jgi:hypothetical protein
LEKKRSRNRRGASNNLDLKLNFAWNLPSGWR